MSDRAEEIAAALERYSIAALSPSNSAFYDECASTIRSLIAELKEAQEKAENFGQAIAHLETQLASVKDGSLLKDMQERAFAAEASLSSLREGVTRIVIELADDLETFVEGHYERIKDHPAVMPKYVRDMELVKRARVFISTLPHDGEGK